MDFCRNETIIPLLGPVNHQGREYVEVAYEYFCPFLILACIISVVLNGILVAIRRSPQVRNTAIIIMSLNLATTDGLVSLFSVLGIMFNSYLPVVFGIHPKSCWILILEILRLTGFVASVLHLLALTWLHYQGTVNPLQHRMSSIFSDEGKMGHLITFFCWLLPLTLFTAYFWSIPCQGFRSENCDFLFILTFKFRFTTLLCFAIPLLIMLYAYIRIFVILNDSRAQFETEDQARIGRRMNQGYQKAAITSLIIVGTYIVCWMPAITFFILSCFDGCPFPLYQLSMTLRTIFGFTINSLVVLKAIVDPFIYCFRMKEIKCAIKALFSTNLDQRRSSRLSLETMSVNLRTQRGTTIGSRQTIL